MNKCLLASNPNYKMNNQQSYIFNLICTNNRYSIFPTLNELWQQITNYFSKNHDEPPFKINELEEIVNDMINKNLLSIIG